MAPMHVPMTNKLLGDRVRLVCQSTRFASIPSPGQPSNMQLQLPEHPVGGQRVTDTRV